MQLLVIFKGGDSFLKDRGIVKIALFVQKGRVSNQTLGNSSTLQASPINLGLPSDRTWLRYKRWYQYSV